MFTLNPTTSINTLFAVDLGLIARLRTNQLLAGINDAFGVTINGETLAAALASEIFETERNKNSALVLLAQLLGLPAATDTARLGDIYRGAFEVMPTAFAELLGMVGMSRVLIVTNIDAVLYEALSDILKADNDWLISTAASCRAGYRKSEERFWRDVEHNIGRRIQNVVVVEDDEAIASLAAKMISSSIVTVRTFIFDATQAKTTFRRLEAFLITAGLATNTEAASS